MIAIVVLNTKNESILEYFSKAITTAGKLSEVCFFFYIAQVLVSSDKHI